MSFSLSSINFQSLSSIVENVFPSYINIERGVSELSSLSSVSDVIYERHNLFSDIKNYTFTKDNALFLTNFNSISSYFNTLSTISGLSLGDNFTEQHNIYDYNSNDFSVLSSLNIKTQYLGILDDNHNYNITPLRTKYSVNDKINFNKIDNFSRNYQKIYNNKNNNSNEVYTQYKINEVPVTFETDKSSLFFNSYNVLSTTINDFGFIKNGAIGGNCPLNSDIVLFENDNYTSYDNVGTFNSEIANGTLLCLWLSSQTPQNSSEKIWAERWYDPNTITQYAALITQKNTSPFSYIVDVPSSKIIDSKQKGLYLRYGPNRNETFVDSFSSNLICNFSHWTKNFTDNINSISGFVIGNYYHDDTVLHLNGAIHAHVPPVDNLFLQNNVSLNLWANSDNWKVNTDNQFFGNFANNDGFGLFYNTGTPNNLVSLPTVSGQLYAFNNKGYKVFEKSITESSNISAISINYIKTDLFGNRFIYDNLNKKIFKIESDDLISDSISFPSNTDLSKIECNSQNQIFVLDTTYNNISSFNNDCSLISSWNVSSVYDNFDIDGNDVVVYDTADHIAISNDNKVIKIVGCNVYIDSVLVVHLPKRPSTLKIDLDNNIWIIYNNTVAKISSEGIILFTRNYDIPYSNNKTIEACFIKTYKNYTEEVLFWLVFNEAKYILIIDKDGNIRKRINLLDTINLNNCVKETLGVKGDFTGFDNKRKFEKADSETISISNPAFSLKMALKCGDSKRIIQLHQKTSNYRGWTNIGFSFQNLQNITIIKLFINGEEKKSLTLNGNYSIDFGNKVAPFIIGGNSGKLGAKNIEKSILNEGFFKGKIADIRLYNKNLNSYEMKALAQNTFFNSWEDLITYLPSPYYTCIEEIKSFNINRYKGFKSNVFNIVIKNFTEDETLREYIKTQIIALIPTISPSNTVLNNIRFE